MKKKSKIRGVVILLLTFSVLFYIFYKTEIVNYYEKNALWLFPGNDDRNGEFLKVILTVIGGIGVLYSLHLAYRRMKATNTGLELQAEAINKQSEQLQLSRKGQVDERFKNAVEHLGNDKEPIILGGIVELHQISKEEKDKYASVVFNILTSYLRSVLRVDLERNNNFSATIPQTIIDFLFRGNDTYLYEGLIANLRSCNFKSLDINGANFTSSDFSFSLMPMYIIDVSFEKAKFGRTNFTIGRLKNVDFSNADFHDNLFNFCEFENVKFSNSKFLTQNFVNSKFKDCNFSKINIYNSNFLLSHFEKSHFNDSELLKVNFCGSNFINCEFNKNKTMSTIDFSASGFYETTFNSECFDCNFTGVKTKYEFDFIQLKNIEGIIGKPMNKSGIIELSDNVYLKCRWGNFTQENYKLIQDLYTPLVKNWEEKYKKQKTEENSEITTVKN